MIKLHRYWIIFATSSYSPLPGGMRLGCGVSAYNREDALTVLKEKTFKGSDLPVIKSIEEDIDITTLDQEHIRPNMGVVTIRGVWFPLGYD